MCRTTGINKPDTRNSNMEKLFALLVKFAIC